MTDLEKEYIFQGNIPFTVEGIEVISDKGTVKVITTRGTYYMDKHIEKIYSDYPLLEENECTYNLFKIMLLKEMEKYVSKNLDIYTVILQKNNLKIYRFEDTEPFIVIDLNIK